MERISTQGISTKGRRCIKQLEKEMKRWYGCLIRKGADINAEENDNDTALHRAISMIRNNAVARMLIDGGANVNAKNSRGKTPLHNAAWVESAEIVQWLVDGGADVNAVDGSGKTVLGSEIQRSGMSEKILLILVNRGVDLNTRELDGSTALHWAAKKGNEAVVGLLIDKGALVDAKDKNERTALHWAARDISSMAALSLVSKGANVKAKSEDGSTVLHEAISAFAGASLGNDKLMDLLIYLGADSRPENKDGKTVLRLAVEDENNAAVILLRREKWALKREKTLIGRQQAKQRAEFLGRR